MNMPTSNTGIPASESSCGGTADAPLSVDLLASDSLVPLPGAVIAQFVRCGKSGCRCNFGHPHGPYFYRVWREGGKVRKVYVKIIDVAGVQAQTCLYEEMAAELRRLRFLRLSVSAEYRQQRDIRREMVLAWR